MVLKDFNKWHSDVKEYIDGLYQINSRNMQKGKSINISELNLAFGMLCLRGDKTKMPQSLASNQCPHADPVQQIVLPRKTSL